MIQATTRLLVRYSHVNWALAETGRQCQANTLSVHSDQLQKNLDEWIDHYNNDRRHQSKICEGRTPIKTLADGKPIWRENSVA